MGQKCRLKRVSLAQGAFTLRVDIHLSKMEAKSGLCFSILMRVGCKLDKTMLSLFFLPPNAGDVWNHSILHDTSGRKTREFLEIVEFTFETILTLRWRQTWSTSLVLPYHWHFLRFPQKASSRFERLLYTITSSIPAARSLLVCVNGLPRWTQGTQYEFGVCLWGWKEHPKPQSLF